MVLARMGFSPVAIWQCHTMLIVRRLSSFFPNKSTPGKRRKQGGRLGALYRVNSRSIGGAKVASMLMASLTINPRRNKNDSAAI